MLFLCASAYSAEYIIAEGSPKPFKVPNILDIPNEQFQADWEIQIAVAIKNRAKAEVIDGQKTGRYFYRVIPPQYPGFTCIIWNSGAVVYVRKP